MKNIIILGSGRSGTSMVAGTLAKAGFFMGDDLYPARESNPKGFFEDPFINGINEQILSQVHFFRTHLFRRWLERFSLSHGQRWLERVPLNVAMPSSPQILHQIEAVIERTPFCLKDPRFSYTLPVWRPFLKNTLYICVFRDPVSTATSIVKECATVDYLNSVNMNFEIATEIWTLMYQHILKFHVHEGDWLFIHYNQMLSEEGLDRFEKFVGVNVDKSFPERGLFRSTSDKVAPIKTQQLYQRLCELAGFRDRMQ